MQHTPQKLKAISRDVAAGSTLVQALRRRGMDEQYHQVRAEMARNGLRTRPAAALAPPSERAMTYAALWNDGYTLAQIGARQTPPVSRQAVSQTLHNAEKHGLLTRPTGRTQRAEKKHAFSPQQGLKDAPPAPPA